MKLSLHLTALRCIVRREVAHIMRRWVQNLFPPAIAMALYLTIFGKLIGNRIGSIEEGFSYLQFITPGLVMMYIITTSYGNVSSSFFFLRFNRAVEEIMVSPMQNWTILLGYVIGAMVRGLLVGTVVMLIALSLASSLPFEHPFITCLSALLASTIFSLLGFINALYAKTLDGIGYMSNYVLTPLAYLGGVFYPVSMLGEPWRDISQINPVMHIIGAFRYGMLGTSGVEIGSALVVMLCLALGLFALALILLGRGIGTRS
jgi:ABC-2 type transport system permease protein